MNFNQLGCIIADLFYSEIKDCDLTLKRMWQVLANQRTFYQPRGLTLLWDSFGKQKVNEKRPRIAQLCCEIYTWETASSRSPTGGTCGTWNENVNWEIKVVLHLLRRLLLAVDRAAVAGSESHLSKREECRSRKSISSLLALPKCRKEAHPDENQYNRTFCRNARCSTQ